MTGTTDVADLRARTAALRDAVDRHRSDPRWDGQPLDALVQRLEELDAAVLVLRFNQSERR